MRIADDMCPLRRNIPARKQSRLYLRPVATAIRQQLMRYRKLISQTLPFRFLRGGFGLAFAAFFLDEFFQPGRNAIERESAM